MCFSSQKRYLIFKPSSSVPLNEGTAMFTVSSASLLWELLLHLLSSHSPKQTQAKLQGAFSLRTAALCLQRLLLKCFRYLRVVSAYKWCVCHATHLPFNVPPCYLCALFLKIYVFIENFHSSSSPNFLLSPHTLFKVYERS